MLNKEGGVTCYLRGLQGGLTEILIFPTYFFHPPLYINSDRSVKMFFFELVLECLQAQGGAPSLLLCKLSDDVININICICKIAKDESCLKAK